MNRWVNEPRSEWVDESMSQWVNKSMSRVNESMSQWVNESMSEWVNESMSQFVILKINLINLFSLAYKEHLFYDYLTRKYEFNMFFNFVYF